MRYNGRPTTEAGALVALVAADGSTGGFIKDSEAGNLPATATNDSASAGKLGEVISATVAVGSAVALTTATAKTIMSIELTAGDWDVSLDAMFTGAGATLVTYTEASLSTTTDTMNYAAGFFAGHWISPESAAIFNSGVAYVTANLAPVRVSLATTTTYYLVVKTAFATSTMSAWGMLRARRMR